MSRFRNVVEDNSRSPRYDSAGMASRAMAQQSLQTLREPGDGAARRLPEEPAAVRCLTTNVLLKRDEKQHRRSRSPARA